MTCSVACQDDLCSREWTGLEELDRLLLMQRLVPDPDGGGREAGRCSSRAPRGRNWGMRIHHTSRQARAPSGLCKCRVKFPQVTRPLSLVPASVQGWGESAETTFFLSLTLSLPKECVPVCTHQVHVACPAWQRVPLWHFTQETALDCRDATGSDSSPNVKSE